MLYPPFASPDAAGNWLGWKVEIINAVCAASAMDCVITPVARDGIIPSLTSGQIDAIMASMSITDERMQTIDFPDMYCNTPTVIVAAKGGVTPDAAGLAGKIIGIQASTIHEAYVNASFAEGAAEVKVFQTQDEANQDLTAGRIDATRADSIALDAFWPPGPGRPAARLWGRRPMIRPFRGRGVGAGVRKGDDALKAQINAGIVRILADGTYEAITKSCFASTISGG